MRPPFREEKTVGPHNVRYDVHLQPPPNANVVSFVEKENTNLF
jgi:hypothetical protein